MKSFKHLFAVCLLLLVATTATAQSQSDNTQTKAVSATKADVNGDGVVNEADIEEILAIMQQENGTKYYWYAGWDEPTEDNIAELVYKQLPTNNAMTTFANAGKTSTTTSGVTFDLLNSKLYDDVYLNAAAADRVKRNYYVVVPNGQGIYDSLGNTLHLTSDNTFTNVGSFTNHTIYRKNDASISITAIIIK